MTTRDDALPNPLPRPPLELTRLEQIWETPSGWRFFKSVNNTNIGLMYIGTAILFFILAGILALIMFASVHYHIPEWFTGLSGLAFILVSLWSSIRYRRRIAAQEAEVAARTG